ncbi:uncharacterized protein LOC131165027 [Malania oleifera]|uniref:uncharacterized protein LOC131165027 n=1 Tax=Malania oleifera TaxID=397392 RepID=UPI0025AE902A|nr:uncharacterized protein LOC131165027 [Malania oleifera]
MADEAKNKGAETAPEACSKQLSNDKVQNAAEGSSRQLPSESKAPECLKPKPKILKKKKAKATPKGEKKIIVKKKSERTGSQPSSKNEIEDGKKVDSRDGNEQSNVTNDKHIISGQRDKKKKRRLVKRKFASVEKEQNKQKNDKLEKRLGNQNNKETHRVEENEKRKEKLGGLIFMCNSKTKPDCFRYRVMGVPMTKKELVLGVKPGLKLFLYDFDLKLMYGIYKASSAGGMKLEPAAFGGAFPVQVHFSVHEDCYPLPESVFRKAMEENYDERNKFKTELTVQQVRKLVRLFRPAEVRTGAPPLQSSTTAVIVKDKGDYEGARESLPHLHRERHARDAYSDTRSYAVLPHERDQRVPYKEVVAAGKTEGPRDAYLTEKEYRTYGLHRERHHPTPPRRTAALEPYQRNHEGEHLLRHAPPIYSETGTGHREPVRHNPLFLKEEEYRVYGLGARQELPPSNPTATAAFSSYVTYDGRELTSPVTPARGTVSAIGSYRRDPYYAREFGGASADMYSRPPGREEVVSGSYSLSGRRESYLNEDNDSRRREIDETERYSRYASDALTVYNRGHYYQGGRSETGVAPVSSRYSFAGPSHR